MTNESQVRAEVSPEVAFLGNLVDRIPLCQRT